jgi:hypothetical protein
VGLGCGRTVERRLRRAGGINATVIKEGLERVSEEGKIMVSESVSPVHQQAEEEGSYVLAERAREFDAARPEESAEGPSENTD